MGEIKAEINLQKIISESIKETVTGSHDPEINISIKLEKLGDSGFTLAHHHFPESNSIEPIYYAASLIKLFHAYLAKHELQTKATDLVIKHSQGQGSFGKRTHMDDVYDAIDASLRLSDNDALSYLVDFNTGAASGLRLDGDTWLAFKEARNTTSEFFREKSGYSKILSIPGKCFSFAPYGREHQLSLEEDGLGRNILNTSDATQIMLDIIKDYPELMQSMRRKIDNSHDEQCQFIAKGLIPYQERIQSFVSKAGWTSRVRHDVAYIKVVNPKTPLKTDDYVFVVMTKNLSAYTELIPTISNKVFAALI